MDPEPPHPGWRDRLWRSRAELRLGARMTVAALLSYAVGEALGLVESYWAVLTAIIVMQANVGGSLKAMTERLLGTIGGSIWGLVVILTLPHKDPLTTGLALLVVLTPLAVLAAFRPGLRVAPVTGAVILLSALASQSGPIYAAGNRVLEIALGCVLSFLVSLALLPARAHLQLAELGGKALDLMADELLILSAMVRGQGEGEALEPLRVRLRGLFTKLDAVGEEALRERSSHLSDGPDPRPFLRTLRRLRNDLVILSRAAVLPVPPEALPALDAPIDRASDALAALLRGVGEALQRHAPPPASDAALSAVERYAQALAALRKGGTLRPLTDEAIARLFSLSFAFDQLRQNMIDLAGRCGEFYRWTAPPLMGSREDTP
jgi:uncharacterized membrane protein YccC